MGRRHSIVKLNSRFSRFQSHFRFPDFNFTSEFTSDGHPIRTSPLGQTVIGDSLVTPNSLFGDGEYYTVVWIAGVYEGDF